MTAIEALTKMAGDETQNPPARESARLLNEVLDHLRWFHDNGVAVTIKPKKNGWTITMKGAK